MKLVPETLDKFGKKLGANTLPTRSKSSTIRYMRTLLCVLPLLLLGCPETRPPIPPAPGGESCEVAEKRLLDLQCKDRRDRLIGGPTLRNKPWKDICRENTANGVDMHAGCITQAPDCEGVALCK